MDPNQRECIMHKSALTGPKQMLNDIIVSDQKELWGTMAFADTFVDLFGKSTWGDVDYNPFVDLVHRNTAPHALHQQQRKNHVQMARLTTSNNV